MSKGGWLGAVVRALLNSNFLGVLRELRLGITKGELYHYNLLLTELKRSP